MAKKDGEKDKSEKKFYFLMISEDFYKERAIKNLLANNKLDMVMIYQLLMVNSLKDTGYIYYENGFGGTFFKQVSVEINQKEKKVKETLEYFIQNNYIEYVENEYLFFPQTLYLTKQESKWAPLKREQRARQKLDNVQTMSNESPDILENRE